MLVSRLLLPFHARPALTARHSLEKETRRRATPWRMLEHPWIMEMQAKKVDMVKFLTQVWKWTDQPAATKAA